MQFFHVSDGKAEGRFHGKIFKENKDKKEKCPGAKKRQGSLKSKLFIFCFFMVGFFQTRCTPNRKSSEPGKQNNQENNDRRTCEVKNKHCKKADNQGAGNDCEKNIHK